MSVYEENYRALHRLLSDLDADAAVLSSTAALPDLHMEVLERSKYTLTVAFLHTLDDNKVVPDMYLKIRVYNDARMAEVLTYQNKTGFARIYTYPNNKVRYPIEKRRVNVFFSEWLAYCIAKDYHCVYSATV